MFGYIKPLKPEMKIKEFDRFKACYCALCHTLGEEYGLASRFILNYDFTFMAMLLWRENEPICFTDRRCPVSPVKKKCMCCSSPSLSIAAGYSIILAWWKLKDSAADDPFFKAIGARMGMLGLYSAYKKAKKRYPEFDSCVREQLTELSRLEKENCTSIDRVADCFATLLSAAAKGGDESLERVYYQLFYHMGRWIYIIDAVNDMDEDIKQGSYNPILARYGNSVKNDEEQMEMLKTTVNHSLNILISAFGLLPKSAWNEIIENIIYLGMPAVSIAVFNGSYNKKTEMEHTDERSL